MPARMTNKPERIRNPAKKIETSALPIIKI
jgi:hypothetical protein